MKSRNFFKEFIFWIIFAVFFWIVVSHFAQTKHILDVLHTGKWYWIGLAALCQLIYYPLYASYVHNVFGLFRVNLSLRNILPIYISSKFTDVALPLSTFGEVAVFVRNGKRNGNSALNVGIGILSAMVLEVMAFVALSAFTLIILYFFKETRTYLFVSLSILAVTLLMLAAIVIRIAVKRKPLNKPILWLIRLIAKIARQGNVEVEEINRIADEMGADLRNGKDKIWPLFWQAIITHLLNLSTFLFVYLAFAGSLNILSVLTGYVASLLFTIVSITPQGIGVAETITITSLHSFGLDIPTAAVITLAFRGLLYWIPMFPGFYIFSHLEIASRNDESK